MKTNAQKILEVSPDVLSESAWLEPVVSSNMLTITRPGRCRYCRCTDLRACDEGCAWLDKEHTVCNSLPCVERFQNKVREIEVKKRAKAA